MLNLLDAAELVAFVPWMLAETAAAETAIEVAKPVESLLSIPGLLTLGMLVLLQIVLGFDNLLYISIESKRVAEESQSKVRRIGISLAIVFRIVLLFLLVKMVEKLQSAFFEYDSEYFTAAINGHSLIVLGGGAFILWTAIKEIYHMLSVPEIDHEGEGGPTGSVAKAITMIVVMNLVFSFDSILSAMALTKNLWIMATAVVISGVLMIVLSDHVAEFLKKNRMYEVLGLFILFIVGVMLVSEGGHLAHLEFFGHEITAMQKSTFYFVLSVLIIVDIVQSRYQKKLLAAQEARASKAA
ncbi:Integral membrane protein TerC family protein [Rubripirellula amarantea]|uniref:Integral membrane protein TerC family protein n=2 Tax=Rubripirellula amarantea TaxID=2527999 RepID=A0A5C5WUY8_9BACT|nr:TerC family protein [Rubripirellula amarantea]TWT53632.1 Integral membrane protein TerC family protein [Rubripirellula amarantea]